MSDRVPTLAELIDRLFRTRLKPNGKEYSTYEAAEAIRAQGYTQTNASHLAKLRRGETANPSRDLLLSLCLFFQVPPSYFFPELEHKRLEPPADVDPQEQVRMALRAVGLKPEDQVRIEQLIDIWVKGQ